MPAPIIVVGGDLGALRYLEIVGAASSGTDMSSCAFGFLNTLPSDGNQIGGDSAWAFNSSTIAGATLIAGDVAGVGLRLVKNDLMVFWYKNGTLLRATPLASGLTSPMRFMASVVNNTAPNLTLTLRPTIASWTNAPADAIEFSSSMVFLDENSGTVSGGGLTIEEGAVANHTPYRTDYDIVF